MKQLEKYSGREFDSPHLHQKKIQQDAYCGITRNGATVKGFEFSFDGGD
jgi:hypothetical protein